MMVTFVIPVNNLTAFRRQVKTFQDNYFLPQYDAPSAAAAYNKGIAEAKTDIAVCCHQDVIFPDDWVKRLEQQLKKIDDSNFGVVGTFGIDLNGNQAGHIHGTFNKFINDPKGRLAKGKLPREVQTLDEHCLILRKDSGLKFDEELGGWHFYGADICLTAKSKGLKNYAIDACLYHGGEGLAAKGFDKAKSGYDIAYFRLQKKWYGKNPYTSIKTTCATVAL